MKHLLITLACLSLFASNSIALAEESVWSQVLPVQLEQVPKDWKVSGVNFQKMVYSADSIIGFGIVEYTRKSDGPFPPGISEPKIFSSHDTGRHWRMLVPVFDPVVTNGACRLDSLHYFWGGVRTRFYYSDDGSVTWHKLDTALLPSANRVLFSSAVAPLVGITSIDHLFITWATFDGGRTFRQVHVHDTIPNSPKDLDFIYRAWVVDSNSFLVQKYYPFSLDWGTSNYLTTDKGKSWTRIGFTIDGVYSDTSHNDRFNGAYFFNSSIGVAHGFRKNNDTSDPSHNVIYRTTDGGRSWITAAVLPYGDDYGEIYQNSLTEDGQLIAQFYRGQVIITADSGKTWNYIVSKPAFFKDGNRDSTYVYVTTSLIKNSREGMICAWSYRSTPAILTMKPDSMVPVGDDLPVHNRLESALIEPRKVVPNPSSTTVSVTTFIANTIDLSSIRVEVYDIVGTRALVIGSDQVQFRQSSLGLNWYDLMVDLSGLPFGVYVVSIQSPTFSSDIPLVHVRP